jgi:hypothetical protein
MLVGSVLASVVTGMGIYMVVTCRDGFGAGMILLMLLPAAQFIIVLQALATALILRRARTEGFTGP